MATAVNSTPKDADLWSSHDKMLAQPLKDNDIEVRVWGIHGCSYIESHVYLLVLIMSILY